MRINYRICIDLSLLCLLLVLLASCTASKGAAGIKITGINDELETKIEVSTFQYHQKDPFMGIVRVGDSDPFFRGYKDKKTDKKSYQLYVRFRDFDWVFWNKAVYMGPNGLVEKAAVRIGGDADCKGGPCTVTEDAIVDLSEEEVRYFVTKPTKVRFSSSKVDIKRDVEINPQEANDFLNKMLPL